MFNKHGDLEISGKCQNFIEFQPSAQASSQKSFVNTMKKFLKSKN